VIADVESTGVFDLDDMRYAPFLDALAFERLPQENLLVYLRSIAWAVRLSRAVSSLGFFPACTERDYGRLEGLVARRDALASQVEDTKRRRRDRELTLNESARLRMELKKLEKELGQTTDEIKEICNG